MAALLKLAAILVGVLILLNRKWDLGLVLLLAAVVAGLLFGQPLLEVGRALLLTAVDPLALSLAVVVVLIMVLGELMRRGAGLQAMAEALWGLVPDARVVIAALPSVVGFLPMIGGAMFSAPLVDEVGERIGADSTSKTFVNYWFRHVWELVLPVYSSFLLAAGLMGLTLTQMLVSMWPLALAAAAGGIAFGLLPLPRAPAGPDGTHSRWQSLRVLAASVWPVVLAVVLSLVLRLDERVNLILALVVTIALTTAVRRIPLHELWVVLRRHIPWGLIGIIFSALAFRRVLETSGSVLAVADELMALGVPVVGLAFGVPFVAGLLTGLMPAAYSMGLSVGLPLVPMNDGVLSGAWAAWLVSGAYLGTMLSPLHLCLSLTRAYFKAGWWALYRRLLPAALLVAATAACMMVVASRR